MDSTTHTHPRGRSSARAWLLLAAAGVATVLLVALIAVACQSGGNGSPLTGGDPSGGAAASDGSPGAGGVDRSPEEGIGGADGDGPGGDAGGSPGGPGGAEESDVGSPLTGFEVVTVERTVPADDFPGNLVRVAVRCPEGKVVLNGGFRALGSPHVNTPFVLAESRPASPPERDNSLWLVAVLNTSDADREVEAYAICVDPPPGYQVIHEDTEAGSSERVWLSRSCPGGTRVLGGGVGVARTGPSTFRTTIRASHPTSQLGADTGWAVRILNDEDERTIRMSTICAEPPAGYELVSDEVEIPAGRLGEGSATCPNTVLGGGVSVDGADERLDIRESYPLVGGISQWRVTLRHIDGANPGFRVWAVCARIG